jgi:predicted glycosyltransferase
LLQPEDHLDAYGRHPLAAEEERLAAMISPLLNGTVSFLPLRNRAAPARRARRSGAPRVVLYSHDTLGFGHLRRNLLIAGALRGLDPAPDVLMIAGMREAGAFDVPPGVDCLTLPAYAKQADGSYGPRDLGTELAPLALLRASAIEAAVTSFDPDLMIVDNVPRGAEGELDATLRRLVRRGRARIVLGLRDVIDEPSAVRRQWIRQRNFEAIREAYDEIWVYGDPSFHDPIATCDLGAEVRRRARYTGYLDQRPRLEGGTAEEVRRTTLGADDRSFVLCTVGGGRDGAALAEAFVQAPLPEGHRGILVTGLQMPESVRLRLAQQAASRPDLTVIAFVPEPVALVRDAAAVIAMGGYNTVAEVLSFGQRALIVPRIRPRAEQLIRAEGLAERGLVDLLHPDALSAEALGRWLAAGPRGRRNTPGSLDMGGLDRVRAFAAETLCIAGRPVTARGAV